MAYGLSVERLEGNPVIRPGMDGRVGFNVNGPSLIRVPSWIEDPLGRYYLYFAHHTGTYIRMAYSDEPAGPWKVHKPGVLDLADSFAADHIASPDVHVDHRERRIRMYYHGKRSLEEAVQETRVALSSDGLTFAAGPEVLGRPYFRVFEHEGLHYALAMPGTLYRSSDGISGFEEGPRIFPSNQRHTALLKRGNTLFVFFTMVGEEPPEKIMVSTIDTGRPWLEWQPSEAACLLAPGTDWEGASLPLEPSARGIIVPPVNQLRDPAIFEDGEDVYLLYAVAGEQGIAIARLEIG